MAHEDSITLNGQTYIVTGPVSARAISEFSAGFKIGRATYDDREHAFFLVMDDFSGGVGFRRIDINEALGGIWDNEGGVDTRRAKHVTLPPQMSTGFTAPTGTRFVSNMRAILTSDISGTELMYMGAGNKIWTVTAARTTPTVVATLEAAGPARVADGVDTLLEWRDPDTNTRRLYAFTINSALDARYHYSSNGSSWTEGTRAVWEGVVWDNKLIVSLPLPAGNPHGGQGQIVAGYSSNGVNWNVDSADANINRPKWFFQGLPHFIGVATAPWGRTAPYFIDYGKLYVLHFYLEQAILIEEVGDKARLQEGGVFEGLIWVTDGFNIWVYDPGASQTVRRVGLYNRFGIPPTLQGYVVQGFVGGTSTLYVVINDDGRAFMRVLAYTGVGWTPITPKITATNPIASMVGRFPIGLSLNVPSRFLDIFCNASELSTTMSLKSFKLPTSGDVPTPGDGFFEDGPLSFETGWYDGGFQDLQGALHRLHCDAFSLTANETIAVSYRIDNAESAPYAALGTFNSSTTTLWFDATNRRGIQFRTVQFKITLDRGITNTLTPELMALTLVYDKKPEFRSAWTFRIDVNRMVESGTLVSGVAATPLNVWSALKTAYDVKTLIPLIVPNVEASPGINVRIVDMPLTYDDFRNAVDGKGYIDISVLQPLAG